MVWQGLFIFTCVLLLTLLLSEVYYFRDEIEGSIGYIFLMAMVFRPLLSLEARWLAQANGESSIKRVFIFFGPILSVSTGGQFHTMGIH